MRSVTFFGSRVPVRQAGSASVAGLLHLKKE